MERRTDGEKDRPERAEKFPSPALWVERGQGERSEN